MHASYRQNGPNRAWIYILIIVMSLSPVTARAQGVSNPYSEDAKRVEAIIKWASGTWGYVQGARTAVGFLTGMDGQAQLTLQDIHETVVEALQDQSLKRLKEDVAGFMDRYHQMQVLARDQVMSGQDMNTLLTSTWGTTHLRDRLTALIDDGTDLLSRIDPILRDPVSTQDEQRAIDVMPAYVMLMPAVVSAMKVAAEIDPARLKRGYDQLVSEKLIGAQQMLFGLVGAYQIYAFEPAKGPTFFHSPVGAANTSWMRERPLYRHYHPLGEVTGPANRFIVYQQLPVIQLALDCLEKAVKAQHAMIVARNVPMLDLFNIPEGLPPTAALVYGYIIQVRN
jgi:hypothetical protein